MAGNFAATPARNDAVARPARDNALGIMDSNASGIGQSMGVTSTSTAFNVNAMDPVMQRCLLQNLNGGRVTHLSRLEQPVPSRPVAQNPGLRSRGRAPPIPRTKKARVPVRRPVVARPGYCENCREKFDDMLEHVKTPQHRRFASNERNWVELDTLLDRVRRPLRKSQAPSSTPHMYTPSSDDGSQSGSASVCSGQLHEAASLNASGHAMQGSWGSTPCSAFASAHMLASGRLSTEATDAAAETPVRAATSTASLARPAASIVDLAYSNTNSSCASPKDVPRSNVEAAESDARDPAQMGDALVTPLPARNFGGVSTGVEAMVSSLETPRFRDEPADQYFDGATLVGAGPHKRPRHSAAASQQQFVTPTRAGADGAARGRFDDSGSATLVQPSRAKQRAEPTKNHASAANRSTNRREMAQDLCRMLHGDPDSV
ncbi:Cdc7p-Dbf4p kinase complex regulatory subunit [Coemansia sp. RSA 2610]|nr:Cdc7p-Dbf4p kinase complex regulatory subunit [Coemansia sp. RSA 2610]